MRHLPVFAAGSGRGPLLLASLFAACAAATAPPAAPSPTTEAPRQDTSAEAPAPAPRASLTRAIDSLLDRPEFRNARWGVLVVHPERGDTLYSRDAGKLFLPASNQKIVTGAAALRCLGPEFRFTTTFASTGPVTAGELRGDLVVHGRGDPTFSARARGDALLPLREMADSLAARGVRRITGFVLPGEVVFLWPRMGYGLAWENLRTRFGAPVADLMVDEGSSRIAVRAGSRIGAPVTVTVHPAIGYPRVRVTATTLPRRIGEAPPVDTLAIDYGPDEVVVRGGIPLGETRNLDLVHQDPGAAFVAAFRIALAARGITVGGVRQPSRVARDTLFVYRSAPLSEISALMQKPSQNQIAEVLKRTLALELTGVGAADSGRRVLEDELLAMGAEPDGFIVGDASGLGRYSFLSPETVVRILHAMRHDPVFVASLPLIGAEGTLASRMRGTAAERQGRAKTGTISNGVALSGYLSSADSEPLLFSILANNWSVPGREVERTIDDLVVLLATIDYRRVAASDTEP